MLEMWVDRRQDHSETQVRSTTILLRNAWKLRARRMSGTVAGRAAGPGFSRLAQPRCGELVATHRPDHEAYVRLAERAQGGSPKSRWAISSSPGSRPERVWTTI